MKLRIIAAALWCVLLAVPLYAQAEKENQKQFEAQKPKKKRVADKHFWIVTGVTVFTAALDGESTHYVQKRCPSCYEVNPIFSRRPSRKELYLKGGLFTAGQVGIMYLLKRKWPDSKAWMIVGYGPSGAHVIASIHNYHLGASEQRRLRGFQMPLACPAAGAGCANWSGRITETVKP